MADQPARLPDDEEEALSALLGGVSKKVKGKQVREYLKPGSEGEKAASRILARLLRADRLPRVYRYCLANLFDPDVEQGPGRESRKLVFAPRRKGGRKGNTHIRGEIAFDVMKAILADQGFELAITTAVKKYGVSESTVARAWRAYKKLPFVVDLMRDVRSQTKPASSRKVSK